VRIRYSPGSTGAPEIDTSFDDGLMQSTLARLRLAGFSTIPSGDTLQLIPDTHLWLDGDLYIVRHLTLRSWTMRQALRDAEFLVRKVQGRTAGYPYPEVA
jgi:hypothetical protein